MTNIVIEIGIDKNSKDCYQCDMLISKERILVDGKYDIPKYECFYFGKLKYKHTDRWLRHPNCIESENKYNKRELI